MHARVLVLCTVLLVAMALPAAAAVPDPPVYVPPVPGPVTEVFDPPATRYGPGHRGISYDPGVGTVVRAAADGVVAFAGSVAGTLHVTLRHPDGVRTTYSYLATIEVVVGQQLHQGDDVGTAGDRFQLGARRGDAYFDPSTLFAGGPPTAHLVPFDDPPATVRRGSGAPCASSWAVPSTSPATPPTGCGTAGATCSGRSATTRTGSPRDGGP